MNRYLLQDKEIWMVFSLKGSCNGLFVCIRDVFQSLKYRSDVSFFHLLILPLCLLNTVSLLLCLVQYQLQLKIIRFTYIDEPTDILFDWRDVEREKESKLSQPHLEFRLLFSLCAKATTGDTALGAHRLSAKNAF